MLQRPIYLLPGSFFLLILISSTLFAAEDFRQFRKGQTVYVHSESGMNLRIRPSRKSAKLSHITYATRLTIASDSNHQHKINYDNISGHWVQVKYEHIRGYVFSGLISRFPTPQSSSFNQYQERLQQKGLSNNDDEQAQIIAQRANLSLREASMIDGFLIARKLFGIPQRFKFPHNSSMRVTMISDPTDLVGNSDKSVQILRDNNGLLNEIVYFDKQQQWVYRSSIKSFNDGTVELKSVRYEN